MIEQTKIAKVWHIDNNELACKNKKIITINFNDLEIAILQSEKDFPIQNLLIKDKNNEYWNMSISPIKFGMFMNNPFFDKEEQVRAKEYKKDITNAYKNLDLKGFWKRKINASRYFNKCELEYIHRYYPDIYEQAQETRELFIENREKEKEQEEQKRKLEEDEKVKTTNDKFKKELKEMKYKIFIGEMVNIADFEFYKDDKYSNGKTTQNNMLYLAKQYAINIPIKQQKKIKNVVQSLGNI